VSSERDVEKARGRLAATRHELTAVEKRIGELEREKASAIENADTFGKVESWLNVARSERERLLLVITRRQSEVADAERQLAEETAKAEVEAALQAAERALRKRLAISNRIAAWLDARELEQLERARKAHSDAVARVEELGGELQTDGDEPDWAGYGDAADILAAGPLQERRARVRAAVRADTERVGKTGSTSIRQSTWC
jgi:hypothetical protein